MLLLGNHSQRLTPKLEDWMWWVGPRVAKFMDLNAPLIQRCNAAGIVTIGRLYSGEGGDWWTDPEANGTARANQWAEQDAFRALTCVELDNEWFGYNNPEKWDAADRRQAAFYDRCKALRPDVEPIAGNCGTGNLLGADWVKHFKRTIERYRVYGFHEYDYPTMWWTHDRALAGPDVPWQWFDYGEQRGNGGCWYTLRYRRVMSEIHKVRPDALAVITECGVTSAVRGYEDLGYAARPQPNNTAESYWLDSLFRHNGELARDAYIPGAGGYVIGATIFQVGIEDGPKWQTFELLHNGWVADRMRELQPGTPSAQFEPTVGRIDIDWQEEKMIFWGRFSDMAAEMGSKAGEPASDIFYWPDGETAFQLSTKGMFVWNREGDKGLFLPASHRRPSDSATEKLPNPFRK